MKYIMLFIYALCRTHNGLYKVWLHYVVCNKYIWMFELLFRGSKTAVFDKKAVGDFAYILACDV